MSIENIYSHIEYLALTIEELEQSLDQREEERKTLIAQVNSLYDSLLQHQKDIDKLEARAQLAEAQVKKIEAQPAVAAPLTSPVKAKPQKPNEPQDDLFNTGWGAQKSGIANDQNALILANKLDSTIDKVQRLLREAGGAA